MKPPLGHAFVPGKTDSTFGDAGTYCAVMLGPAKRCNQSPGAHLPKPPPATDRATRLRAIAALHTPTPGGVDCPACEVPSPCETWTIAADPLWEGEAS